MAIGLTQMKISVFFYIFVFFLALILIISAFFARRRKKYLKNLIEAARKFAHGDFSHKITLNLRGETGELVSILNKMSQTAEGKMREIAVQNQHLGAILQSMVESIIVVDKDSRVISLNSAAEKIFGIKRREAESKLFLEVIPNNDIAELITDTLSKGRFLSRELSLAWPVQKIFRIDATPVFEKDGINSCLIVIHDITEARRIETIRKDFIANVSHELKTPLTSIKGFVETLLEGAVNDKENAEHFLNIIKDHTGRLDNLVNDLLSLSYLESKEAALKKEKISLKNLVDDILAGFTSQLKKRSIKARNESSGEVSIFADRDKLGQVLTNLIDNAIKFNMDNGSIRIYDEEVDNNIRITVEDTGIGIAKKDIPRIFERFYRVDKARSREMGGTGLGLSIVKHIVELHGGMAGAESTDGAGSKFFFTLPR